MTLLCTFTQTTLRETQSNKRHTALIIHNNVSSYAQASMQFQETNIDPSILSNKRLKIPFHERFHSTNTNSSTNIIVIPPSTPPNKTVISFEEDDSTPAETQQKQQQPITSIVKPSYAQDRQSYSSLYSKSDRGRRSSRCRGG